MATLRRRTRLREQEPENADRDLGFGSIVSQRAHTRLLNRDGSFNVRRSGHGFGSHSLYHLCLTMSWPRFFGMVIAFFVVSNTMFAVAYTLCGADALSGPLIAEAGAVFWRAFFFSVQTFSTIGYGHISPSGMGANILVTMETLYGLLGFALITGLLFARFSRPIAKIIFSRTSVIMPYKDASAFAFRMTNARSNQLIELECRVIFSRFEEKGGRRVRQFHTLALERSKVSFFPLAWTVVHAIDEESPLYGCTPQDLEQGESEFLVLLTGIDETFSQMVHTRSSYRADEVAWNARFVNIFNAAAGDGDLSIDVGRLHQTEPAPVLRHAAGNDELADPKEERR